MVKRKRVVVLSERLYQTLQKERLNCSAIAAGWMVEKSQEEHRRTTKATQVESAGCKASNEAASMAGANAGKKSPGRVWLDNWSRLGSL